MTVNDGQPIHGSVSGRFQGLDLLTPLYIGSVPNATALYKTVGIRYKSFRLESGSNVLFRLSD